MKQPSSDWFATFVAVSFVSVMVGGILLVGGAILQFGTSSLADCVMRIGAVLTDMGILGLALCHWEYKRGERSARNKVTLLTVLRRSTPGPPRDEAGRDPSDSTSF